MAITAIKQIKNSIQMPKATPMARPAPGQAPTFAQQNSWARPLGQSYDPSKFDSVTQGMNEAIAKTLGKQWGFGNVQYDPTTGKLKTAGQYQGRAVDPAMRKYVEQAKSKYFQKAIRDRALENYNKFDVDKYVQGEADVYRRNLAGQLAQGQAQLAGNENARGMLFSGRKQKAEMGLNQGAAEDFSQYRNSLVQDALKQKQALAADPLLGQGNLSLQQLENKFR